MLAALAASKSSEYLEEEAGRLQGSVFIPSLLTGILAPHVSTFCSSILVRRQHLGGGLCLLVVAFGRALRLGRKAADVGSPLPVVSLLHHLVP